jgi:hypothetical protein
VISLILWVIEKCLPWKPCWLTKHCLWSRCKFLVSRKQDRERRELGSTEFLVRAGKAVYAVNDWKESRGYGYEFVG